MITFTLNDARFVYVYSYNCLQMYVCTCTLLKSGIKMCKCKRIRKILDNKVKTQQQQLQQQQNKQ